MLHMRTVVSGLLVVLVGVAGCAGSRRGDAPQERNTGNGVAVAPSEQKGSHGVAPDAQPQHKTGHGAPVNPPPEHKTGHGGAPAEHKTGHGASPDAPPPPKTTGTALGEVKSTKNSPDGKNVMIEVLQPGEEKARGYHVVWNPERKAPNPEVVAAVRAAGVGDRVQFDWVQTGHGPAITKFDILQKAAGK